MIGSYAKMNDSRKLHFELWFNTAPNLWDKVEVVEIEKSWMYMLRGEDRLKNQCTKHHSTLEGEEGPEELKKTTGSITENRYKSSKVKLGLM